MPDVGAALRGRTFGIPNGVLLVAVAAGIWWFFIRGKTGKAATTNQAAAAGSQLESGYGLGFAQGQQAAQANQPPPGAPTTPAPAQGQQLRVTPGPNAPPGGTFLRVSPTDFTGGAFVPTGVALTQNGTPTTVPVPGVGSVSMIPVSYLGGSYWVSSYDVTPIAGGAGVGGGAPIRKHHIGSRSAWLHHDAHPLIGAPVKYAHYVRVGGPKSAAHHQANVNRVAAQAGVHPARVAMLNPVPTGLIRIA